MKTNSLHRVGRFMLQVIKWTFIVVFGITLLLLLLLALDRDYRTGPTAEVDWKSIEVNKEYDRDTEQSRYDHLLEKHGRNKKLAGGFELQCLLALAHYPELAEVPIEFQVKPAFLPLASRPAPPSVLFPWVKRKYLVIISSESADFFEKILLKNTPFNEQIGIIGHELAHTLYYLDKTALQLAKIAYRYEYDETFHTAFERDTDKRAVAHGLGYQMYDFAFFVRKAFGDSQEEIAAEEGDTYLSPKEIAMEMQQYPFYEQPLNPADSYFD